MLNLTTKTTQKTSDGRLWDIYQKDDDAAYYYVTPQPYMATDKPSGNYQFLLTEYTNGGGYCQMTIELDVPPADLSELTKYVQTQHPGAHLETLRGNSRLYAQLTFHSVDGKVSGSVSATPSTADKNPVVFLIELDAQEIELFKQYFEGDAHAGTFQILYRFGVAGRLPALTITSTFNSSVAYEYEELHKYVYDEKK